MGWMIQAEDVRKTYRIGKVDVQALRGVSLQVEKGEFVTIVGPSGSGKSTLFYILGGLTHADTGRVIIDGVDFTAMSDSDRTRLRRIEDRLRLPEIQPAADADCRRQHRDCARYRRLHG